MSLNNTSGIASRLGGILSVCAALATSAFFAGNAAYAAELNRRLESGLR